MKKLLLPLLIIALLIFVAQKIKSSFLSYPIIDAANVDVNTVKVDFCSGDMKFMSKSTKKTTNACKVKGGSIKDAKAIEVFYYNFTVLSPVSYVKISDSNGDVKFMEKVTDSEKSYVDFGKKKCYWAEPVLESAYKKEKSKFEGNSNKNNLKSSIKSANKFIDAALFFTYVPQEFGVFYVKSKDHDYSDLEKASAIAAEGYGGIKNNAESKEAQSKLKQAISMWEKALAESTPDDKKSRINKKVTLHISENLGRAYMYLMDFDNAQKAIGGALKLEQNFTNNGTTRRKALLAEIRKYKKGYELNKETPINLDAVKVNITTHPSSEIASFTDDYKKYGNAALVEEIKTSKEEYNKAVESGEVNPYQRYVIVATTGTQLTLPDLASKLAKEPAGEKLDELPEDVTKLTELTILILRGNNLKTLPASIGNLTGLKKLVLVNNQLTSLPDEIGNLKSLKNLNIKGNNIPANEVARIQALIPNCKIKQ